MVSLNPPVCNFGSPAPDFALRGIDGNVHTLASAKGPKGLLVMFICNHCPYVQAIIDRLVRDCRELSQHGIGNIAIMPNDVTVYPEDDWPHMRRWAQALAFPFPYVMDETQSVARAYGAVCTPDFFGFNADLQLQYRGRLDSSRREPAEATAKRELFDAMLQIAHTGRGPDEQVASIGCSIKWREAGHA